MLISISLDILILTQLESKQFCSCQLSSHQIKTDLCTETGIAPEISLNLEAQRCCGRSCKNLRLKLRVRPHWLQVTLKSKAKRELGTPAILILVPRSGINSLLVSSTYIPDLPSNSWCTLLFYSHKRHFKRKWRLRKWAESVCKLKPIAWISSSLMRC